jgi:carboxyl-terminal processing protease
MRERMMGGTALVVLSVLVATPPAAAQQRSVYEDLQAFTDALTYARLNYVDSVNVSRVVGAAIEGALHSLDPHSYYLTQDEWDRFADWQHGRWITTGLFLENEEGVIAVAGVAPNSPAAHVGIVAGDRVTALNDTAVAGVPVQRLQAELGGERGTKLRLTLERGSRLEPQTFRVTIKRSPVEVRSTLTTEMIDSITGYVRLQDFKLGAGQDIHDALRQLLQRHARQVLLDLRGNPGGSIPSAVEVAAQFLPARTLVFRTRGRKADSNHEYSTDSAGAFRELPLIVLIDRGSASAAEALAACLQDHDRALILGRRSFGKALVQVPFPLRAGGVVMLTVARVVSPSGRVIQRPYEGLGYEQYLAMAGTTADPTATGTFKTDRGRSVSGGGGVGPDIVLPGPPPPPAWWSVVADSGWADAVADSVARSLTGSVDDWIAPSDRWRSTFQPFYARVRRVLHAVPADTAVETMVARVLASRIVGVKWGDAARERFMLRNDPDIEAAVTYFPRLPILLPR